MIKSSTIKVTFNGETKRIQTPTNYENLLALTKASFPQSEAAQREKNTPFKFFFLDEEHELISISTQTDFDDNCEYIQVAFAPADQDGKVPSLIYSDSAS